MEPHQLANGGNGAVEIVGGHNVKSPVQVLDQVGNVSYKSKLLSRLLRVGNLIFCSSVPASVDVDEVLQCTVTTTHVTRDSQNLQTSTVAPRNKCLDLGRSFFSTEQQPRITLKL